MYVFQKSSLVLYIATRNQLPEQVLKRANNKNKSRQFLAAQSN